MWQQGPDKKWRDKIGFASLNSPVPPRSFLGALVCSEINVLVFKEVKLVCGCSIIECSHIQVIASTKQQCLKKYKNPYVCRHERCRFTHVICARTIVWLNQKTWFWAQGPMLCLKSFGKHLKNAKNIQTTPFWGFNEESKSGNRFETGHR